jgi:cardiolipin synthase (CMP-forming)
MTLSQLPNLITLSRIALAPVLILFLKDQDYLAALVVIVVAGLSDGLDGLIAKRFHATSRLGGILDPVADKILLISAYVMLTILDQVPFWLMLTVVFRDLLIVGGFLVFTLLVGSVHMRPSYLSKINTFVQILLVVLVLVVKAAELPWAGLVDAMVYVVLATTTASGLHYLWIWLVKKEVELDNQRTPHA